MRAYRFRYVVVLAAVAAPAWPRAALAQYLQNYFPSSVPGYNEELGVTVLSRLRPLYEQPGVHAGSFIIRPNLDEALGYNSNPIGIKSSPGSWLLRTAPSVSANSDWSRNSLGLALTASNDQYWNTPRQSRTDWSGTIGGGYTIGREDLTVGFSHLSLHQIPGDVGAVPSDTPVHFRVNDLRSSYTFDLGRLSLIPNVDVTSYDFDNTTILGVPTSQQYRNRVEATGGVTTQYKLSDLRSLLFVLQGVDSHYTTPSPGTPTLNSKSVLALAGIDYVASGVWRYRVLVGAETRQFQSPVFKSHTAPIAAASVIWTPTGLTTVTTSVSRLIEDTAAEGTAGYTYTNASLVVDHEYLRNVLLQGRTGVQVANYLLGGGTQARFTVGAGITWLMNRRMQLSANYDFTTQNGVSQTTAIPPPNLTALNTGGYSRSLFLVAVHFGL